MDNPGDAPAPQKEAELREQLAQSEKEAFAGLTVPLSEVLAELEETIVEIKTQQYARRA